MIPAPIGWKKFTRSSNQANWGFMIFPEHNWIRTASYPVSTCRSNSGYFLPQENLENGNKNGKDASSSIRNLIDICRLCPISVVKTSKLTAMTCGKQSNTFGTGSITTYRTALCCSAKKIFTRDFPNLQKNYRTLRGTLVLTQTTSNSMTSQILSASGLNPIRNSVERTAVVVSFPPPWSRAAPCARTARTSSGGNRRRGGPRRAPAESRRPAAAGASAPCRSWRAPCPRR